MAKTFIWSNWFPKHAERMEAMSFANEILSHEACETLELTPMAPIVERAPLRPAEGLKPFRHGEFAKWN